jgi:SNF2 family DNA or RNA helicase
LSAWQRGQSLVPLAEGGFAELPVDWMQRYGQIVADLLAARGGSETLPAFALPDLARLCSALGESPPPGFERLRVLVEDFDGLPEATLPEDLEAELRPYQLRGVRWLQFLRDAGLGGLLADDMGLGKTLQALCGVRGRTLVVAPTSVVYGWQEQIERFRPGLRTSLYHGPRRQLDADAALTLTTYGVLRLDAERLAGVHWDTVVLDEAQAIKNPDSQVARAAHSLRGDFRLTLTGTPVQNRLDELWSQLHFVNPGLLGTRQDFRHRYESAIAEGEPGAAARLRERIRPFVLRRIKHEVAPELPPRTEAVLHCELSDTETSIYEAVRAATRGDLVERLQAGGGVLEALEALLRLRQAACHPALLPGRDAAGSSKVDVLLEALEEVIAEDHKALVFSQWTSFLDLVEPHLRAAGLRFGRLDGSTRDRAGVITRFQDQDGPPVLLISLRAGGVGLNLTAADHVFLLDPWWNPAVEDQAADRAHRIGQDRPVMIYRLVSRETVEERILALQARKRAVAEAVLEGTDHATSITREELLALLD